MQYLIISSSLNPESRSRLLAKNAFTTLENMKVPVEWMDLSQHSIPVCDGNAAHENKQVQELRSKIDRATGIILAVPVYNYYASAAAKNLIELTGRAWSKKVVGFLCAAGGMSSYMSIMSLANSLMLDFRCLIIPGFVYSTGEDFTDEVISNSDLEDRIRELAMELKHICTALNRSS